MENKTNYKRYMFLAFSVAAGLAAAYLFFEYLLPVIMPFFIAWLIAFSIQKIMNKLRDKAKIPKKFSALVLVLAVTAALGFICYLVLVRIYGELASFAENALQFITRAQKDPEFAALWIKKIDAAIPFLHVEGWLTDAWNAVNAKLETATLGMVTEVTSKILPILGDMITFVPEAIMYIFVIVFSSYYFAVDFEKINRFFLKLLPPKVRETIFTAKREMRGTFGKLLRAYGFIILLTFTELFIFLSLIGIKYSLTIAFFIALIDILPVLGTGTVLIPWGLALLLMGNTAKGAAILGAYAFITILREIIEPKLVGKSMGIHPLAALAALYVGFRFFGVVGMLVLPISIMLCKNIVSKSKKAPEGLQDEKKP